MIAERADCPSFEQERSPGRQLRNLLLLANVFVWLAIIILISLFLF